MADPIKKQFDALKAWSIDLYEELQGRNVHAALKLCKNINTQARKLEYRGRGLSGLPNYLPVVQELKQNVSSARAGVQQIAGAMENAERIRKEAKEVKSVYERKQAPLFAAAGKNAASVMEMVKEAGTFYGNLFNFEKEYWFSKFVGFYKKESFFPRLMTDALNRKGLFRHHAPKVGGLNDFSTANLQNADLRNINDVVGGRVSFVGADLRSADLRRVKAGLSEDEPWDFSHANLRNADVKDANFIYAKGLNPVQFINTRNWQSARVSPEFRQMLRQSSFHALQQEQRRRALGRGL